MMRRRSNEKRTAEEKREGLTKVDAANAPCAVLKAVGRRPLDKRRSATAIAIFCKLFSQKPHHLRFTALVQTDRKFIELSLGVHTAMDFPWGNGMWKGTEGGREVARRLSLVDERRRPVVVSSWGHWEWCMNNGYHG
jgi:hypothetical protein